MLTLSHIAYHLSTTPTGPTVKVADPPNYCVFCGVLLADPKLGTPVEPLTCPLTLDGHEWRQCAECSNIASTIWYYAGAGESYLPKPRMKGAALDVYIWILRENPQNMWTRLPIPEVARRLRYSRGAIAAALVRLRKRGYLEKRPRTGRYGEYKPLIWQRPKGE